MSDSNEKTGRGIRFYMIEPIQTERLEVFGVRYQIWQRILQSTYANGHVHVTQQELANEYEMSVRAIKKHYAAFREAGMLERSRNPEGRVALRVSPEYHWNYKLEIRNRHVAERKSDKQSQRRQAMQDQMIERGISVINGGKSA